MFYFNFFSLLSLYKSQLYCLKILFIFCGSLVTFPVESLVVEMSDFSLLRLSGFARYLPDLSLCSKWLHRSLCNMNCVLALVLTVHHFDIYISCEEEYETRVGFPGLQVPAEGVIPL